MLIISRPDSELCSFMADQDWPNLVLRGPVYPPEIRQLSKKVQHLFELSLQSRTLSPHNSYAGKICAALDRQHPRDLFDVERIENLPAVKWKLLNIARMDPSKHQKAVRKLRDYLGV